MGDSDSFFIDDGMERKGYVKAWPTMHPALRFWYRPFGARERARIIRQINEASEGGGDAVKVACDAVGPRLLRWEGPASQANAEAMLRLEPNLQMRVRNIVLHLEAPDEDPQDGKQAEHPDATEEKQLGN